MSLLGVSQVVASQNEETIQAAAPGVTASGVLCPHKNLVVAYATVTTVDIDADELILHNPSNISDQKLVTSVNLTVTITSSGANGLDTGNEGSSTWYHLYVIYNPSTTTTAGLASTSSTAPTMPSGYTYMGYVGAIYNDSGSDFLTTAQKNNRVVQEGVRDVDSGTATSPTSFTPTIPSTATMWYGTLKVLDAANTASVYLYGDSAGSMQLQVRGSLGGATSVNLTGSASIPVVTSQTLWYAKDSDDTDVDIWTVGWSY